MRHLSTMLLKPRTSDFLPSESSPDVSPGPRPDGCWCSGSGGRQPRYIPPTDLDCDAIEVLSEYCTCPEAAGRKAADDGHRSAWDSDRRRRRVVRMFKQADIPPLFAHCTFETYPGCAASKPALDAVQAWSVGGDNSLLLYGTFGTGKTGLAVAAMRHRIEADGVDALFLTTPQLLDRIRSTYGPRRMDDESPDESQVLDAVRSAGLLVLDDLGAERPSDWVQEKLFVIINHRHDNMLPTIFTSNLNPEGLAKHLGERIAWRIVEMATVIRVDGPNLRARGAA